MLHKTMLYGYMAYRYWLNSGYCHAPDLVWMQ